MEKQLKKLQRSLKESLGGASLLSELAGQTRQVAKKMQQFEGTLA